MLNFIMSNKSRDCDGVARRDFLRIGGLGSLSLAGLLSARADAASKGQQVKDTSVIWIWLAGGPTHIETFNPNMTAPSEYRSVTGEVSTNLTGVTFGGTLPKLANVADKMAVVRSFSHKNSGHGGGTHWVMTGYNNRNIDNGGLPARPSMGSIAARVRGATNTKTGMPTYIRLGGIGSDGPAFLGKAYSPFNPSGEAKRNMQLSIKQDRLDDRRKLLKNLDQLNRSLDARGTMLGLDKFEQQAFNLVSGSAVKAFDTKDEKPATIQRYGRRLGASLLRARKLCEAGAGFVTISYGGWDMHSKIKDSMTRRSPELDQAISALIEDIYQRGLDKKILVVISGEFGRTPKVNKSGGRDHWAPLSTLALAGGGLKMGQVIGQSAAKADVPKSNAIGPQDLMATVFHTLGIDPKIQFINQAGRPVSMIEKGKPIEELI